MRYNIFNTVHLPLKTALLTASVAVSRIIEKEAFETSDAVKKVGDVLHVFHEQVTYETLHILPLVFEYEPSIWNNYNADHDEGAKLSNKLKSLLKVYRRQEKNEGKQNLMGLINDALNEFVVFNFNHMDDEEPVLNEILWRYYNDRVLTQVEKRLDILPHLAGQSHLSKELEIATAA